jgi:hypothetical protein
VQFGAPECAPVGSAGQRAFGELGLELSDAAVGEPVAGAGGFQPFFQVRLSPVSWRARCSSAVFSVAIRSAVLAPAGR